MPPKIPISQQPDYIIDDIREFKSNVNNLKRFRAKGFCEICWLPFGITSEAIQGHHIVKPSSYKGKNPQDISNIVICCQNCYETRVLTGNKSWVKNIGQIKRLKSADDILEERKQIKIKEQETQEALEKDLNSLVTIGKFYGIRFRFKKYKIKLGFSVSCEITKRELEKIKKNKHAIDKHKT